MLRTPPRLKRVAGRLAYPLTALALLSRHRPLRAPCARRGGHAFVTHQLYVANGGSPRRPPDHRRRRRRRPAAGRVPGGWADPARAAARHGPQRGHRPPPHARRRALPRGPRAVAGDRPAGARRGRRRAVRADPDPRRPGPERAAGDGAPPTARTASALTGKVHRVASRWGSWRLDVSATSDPTRGGAVAEPVRVRRLTDQEGQRLQQIVRRGSTSSVRYRRAMMLLASAGGNPVPVIARLVAGRRGHRPRRDPPVQRDRPGLPGPSVGGRPSPPDQS